ncbi:MAG: ArsR/SmtB family transcription factor [Sphingomonadaceae bacterium]
MNPDELIEALKALAHPVRFRILESLRNTERNVSEIEELTGIGQPALSQQLAVLRNAGMVQTRKSAKLVFYRLDERALALLRDAIGAFVQTAAPVAERKAAVGAANFARLS